MVAYTTTYSFAKPTVGDDEDVWGGYLNGNFDSIEALLNGTTALTTIDVTGNITVGGTVDGRDVAADGSKLDGIEAGATADQTKADIDALGIAASTAATLATARNIALTGAVTGNVNFDGSGNVSISTTATSDPTLTLSGDASGSATFTNLGNATLNVTVADDSHNHVISNIDGLQTALDGKLSTTGKAADSNLLDGYNSSQSESVNTVAVRNASGYLFASYFNGTGTFSTSGATSGMGRFTGTNGSDTYGRSYTAQAAATLLSGATMNINGTATNITQYTINQSVGTGNSPTFSNAYIAGNILHSGDTNTYIGFHAADQWRVVTGGAERFEVNNSDVTVQSALKEKYVALSGTTPSIDVDAGGGFSLTMTGNTTFTFTAFSSGLSSGFVLQLTGNGSTVTWPASVDWAGGTAPDAPASGETDIYVFWSRDGGTTWYGVQSIDAAA